MVKQGPSDIAQAIFSLGPHKFCPREVVSDVVYDVVPLTPETGGGILLTVHANIVNPSKAGPASDHVLSLNQSFMLRYPRAARRIGDDRWVVL